MVYVQQLACSRTPTVAHRHRLTQIAHCWEPNHPCCMQVVGSKHVLEEFRVGVTAVMLAAQQDIRQGNLKHKDLTGQEVSSQVCLAPPCPPQGNAVITNSLTSFTVHQNLATTET